MEIMLDGVCSTENEFEGTDEDGNIFRIYGTFIYQGDHSRFESGTILSGPAHLHGQACEVEIDDTTATLRFCKKVSPEFTELITMA